LATSHPHAPPLATTHPHTLSLHDALPIFTARPRRRRGRSRGIDARRRPQRPRSDPEARGVLARDEGRARRLPLHHPAHRVPRQEDRKSTRLNSSHQIISYAVFCLKKKKNK